MEQQLAIAITVLMAEYSPTRANKAPIYAELSCLRM